MAVNHWNRSIRIVTACSCLGMVISGMILGGCNKTEPEATTSSPAPAGTPIAQTPDKMDTDLPGGGPKK